jgi:hypothetical protein
MRALVKGCSQAVFGKSLEQQVLAQFELVLSVVSVKNKFRKDCKKA